MFIYKYLIFLRSFKYDNLKIYYELINLDIVRNRMIKLWNIDFLNLQNWITLPFFYRIFKNRQNVQKIAS